MPLPSVGTAANPARAGGTLRSAGLSLPLPARCFTTYSRDQAPPRPHRKPLMMGGQLRVDETH